MLTKRWILAGKTTGNDTPERFCSDCGRLCTVEPNHITCRFWPCSRLVMLAAKADLPTPGAPLIQITLWPLVFLIPVTISCKMSWRVPGIHGSRRGSLSPPRVCTKSSSCCATRISIARSVSSWFLDPSTFFHNSITLFFWGTARMYLAWPMVQLKSHAMQTNTHQASSQANGE